MTTPDTARFRASIEQRTATVAIIGQGYVGLPVAMRASEQGFRVVGFDRDETRIAQLRAGHSYVEDVPAEQLAAALARGYLPSSDPDDLAGFDVAVISVPTPLRDGAPDLSYIEAAAHTLATRLTPGALVVLESTTYPGTTEELLRPILEADGRARGHGLLPRLLPRAHRPRQHGVDLRDDAQGRVRCRRRVARGGRGVLRRARRHGRAGRVDRAKRSS